MATELALDDPRWLAFIAATPDAQIFHHPVWTRVVAGTYGFESFAVAELGPDGAVVAGIPIVVVKQPFGPARWVALPFTDYCPILGTTEASARLVQELDRLRAERGARVVEVRAPVEGPGARVAVAAVMHTLELDADPAAVARRFTRSSVLRNIRKAERQGVEVVETSTAADFVDAYYRLHLDTRRRQGVPAQPRRFFERLWSDVLAQKFGFVLLAYHEGQPIAGAVFLAWNRTMTYKYGASDARHWELRPNNLLFWRAIERGCRDGYAIFNLGRTDLDNRGLREFKTSWGAAETPLEYSTIGGTARAASHGTGRAGALLAAIIRRSPPVVCRAIGAALYRYAA